MLFSPVREMKTTDLAPGSERFGQPSFWDLWAEAEWIAPVASFVWSSCPAAIALSLCRKSPCAPIPWELAGMQPVVGRDSCTFCTYRPLEVSVWIAERIKREMTRISVGHCQVSWGWVCAEVYSKESKYCTGECIPMYSLSFAIISHHHVHNFMREDSQLQKGQGQCVFIASHQRFHSDSGWCRPTDKVQVFDVSKHLLTPTCRF